VERPTRAAGPERAIRLARGGQRRSLEDGDVRPERTIGGDARERGPYELFGSKLATPEEAGEVCDAAIEWIERAQTWIPQRRLTPATSAAAPMLRSATMAPNALT